MYFLLIVWQYVLRILRGPSLAAEPAAALGAWGPALPAWRMRLADLWLYAEGAVWKAGSRGWMSVLTDMDRWRCGRPALAGGIPRARRREPALPPVIGPAGLLAMRPVRVPRMTGARES